MLDFYHLSTVEAILGELLIKDPHLCLVQFSHHQLQLLVRSAPFPTVNALKWLSHPLASLVKTEEVPTVSIDGPHRKCWMVQTMKPEQNFFQPEPILKTDLRLDASSSQLL